MRASRGNVLDVLVLVPAYMYWHYAKATKHIWRIAGNISWFLWHFFSVELLAKSLFSPWWRQSEPAHLSFFSGIAAWSEFFSAIFSNVIVTLFGVVVRGIVIILGLLVQVLLWAGTCLFFLLWLILPAGVLYLLLAGIVFIARPL